MDNHLNNSVFVYIFKDHVKLLLFLWLFWINLLELQTKFTSEEITVNSDNNFIPIKCKNVTNQLTGHCYCPKTSVQFKSCLCQFNDGEENKKHNDYLCSCDHRLTKANLTKCECVSQEDSLTVNCSGISNTSIIKVGILIPFTIKGKTLHATYFSGIYYASAMFVARDDINQNKFLLPNHRFDLVWGDTECNKKKTTRLAMKMIEEQQVDALIGVGCDGCLEIAAIAGIFNIPMISNVRVMTFNIVIVPYMWCVARFGSICTI